MLRFVPRIFSFSLSYIFLHLLENMKSLFMAVAQKKSVDEIGGRLEFLAGLASGCITAVLTNPMDVVTSRLMTTDKHLYSGVSDCMRRLYKDEGPRVFMLGVKARVATIAPYTCIYLAVNEQMKRSLARCRGRGGINTSLQPAIVGGSSD